MENRTERAGHDHLREWLTLEADDGDLLSREERRRLEEHVSGCAACRAERAALVRMDALLVEGAVPVRAGFRHDVMRSLPAAGWEARAPRTWWMPVAVLVLLVLGAGVVATLPSAGAGTAGALSGAAGALLDMIATGALAATGMLWASWRGVGLVVDAYLSPGVAVALLVLVVSLDVLLLSFLVRRGRTAPEAVGEGGRRGALRGPARRR